MSNPTLQPEDYTEPRCLLDMSAGNEKAPIEAIPIRRVIEKLDEYLTKSDYPSAERHIKYWLAEAEAGRDFGGLLSLTNELMGLYRNELRADDAINTAERGLELAAKAGYDGTVTGATTLLNAATVFKAFGRPERAVPLYEQAREIYEQHLSGDEYKLGGLYNNMALALVDLKRYDEAFELYEKAISVMEKCENCEPEQAVTCLNMANAVEARDGLDDGAEQINKLLERAESLMNTPTLPHTGYYAYYCEKCAPTFEYYGWFAFAEELKGRAKKL